MHRSRDTANAEGPFQVMVMWSDWVTHNSGIDNHRKLRISNYVLRMKLFILHTPPRSKGQRSRSQGQMKIVHKTSNICRKRHRIVEAYPSYRKSWSLNTMVTADFRPEAEFTLFLRVCTKEISKTWWKCIPTEELLCCYRKSGSPKRMARSHFWP